MESIAAPLPQSDQPRPNAPGALRSVSRRAWLIVCGVGAIVLGLLPHVLHHAGPLAGAALFAGVGGSLLFGVLGLVAAIPFLLGLRQRSGGWQAPLAALAMFAAVFSISTFVIGPQISGADESGSAPSLDRSTTAPAEKGSAHDSHH
ncbi:MAG: hypothetical protein ABI726_10620 [bacterium]